MKNATKRVLASIGSILVLAPSTSYAANIPTLSSEQRMQYAWHRTGQQLMDAMNQHQEHYEPKIEAK